jgi:hypothetical protein
MVEVAVAVAAVVAGTATTAQALVLVAAANAFAAVVAPIAGSLIVGWVASAVMGGAGGGAQSAAPSTFLKQPIPVGQVIYGTARVGGSLAVFHRGERSGDEKSLHMLGVIACHEIDGVAAIYDGDVMLWNEVDGISPDYAGRISRVVIGYGTPDQGPILDLIADLPDTMAGDFGLNFRLRGHAYVYLVLPDVRRKWASGLPQIWCDVRGAKVFDPRTGSAAFSANWALCVAHYLTLDRGGAGYDMAADVVSGALASAANISDELVALSGGGSVPRYQINGVISSDLVPREVLAALMNQGAGNLIDSGGRFVLRPGAHGVPVAVIDAAAMRSVAAFKRAVDVEALPDGVQGVFTDPAAAYQADGFGAIMFADYAPEDGAARMLDMQLLRETVAERAQRLAVIAGRMSRRVSGLSVEVSAEFAYLEGGDVVAVQLPQAGLSGELFEISSVVWKHEPEAGRVAVLLEMVETSAEVFAWSVSDAVGVAPVALVVMASGRYIAPVVGVAAVPVIRFAADGSAVPGLAISWTPSDDFFLSGYEVTLTPSGGVPRMVAVRADAASVTVEGLAEGEAVAVEVVARNIFGLTSAGADPGGPVAPVADTAAPSVPADFAAAGGVDRVTLSWTVPPELDFAAVIVREAAADDFGAAVEVWRGNAASVERPGVSVSDPRFWWSASVDRSGNVSAWVGPVSAASTQVQAGQVAADAIGTAQILDGSAVDYGAAYDAGAVGVAGGSVWTVVQSVRVWRDAPGALAIWCGCGFQGGAPNSGEGDVATPVYFRVLVDGVEVAALSKTGEGISGRFEGHTVLENAAAGGLSTVTMQLKGISSLEGVARTLTAIMLKRSALPVLPPI